MRSTFIILLTLCIVSCSSRKQPDESPGAQVVDSASVYKEEESQYDYSMLYGVYVHESSASGFSATLTLEKQGFNIAFTLISSKGESCKGEASGIIAIMDHNENYHTGYYIEEDCKLEIIFRYKEQKVDIREIHLCTLHDTSCGFDGTYAKTSLTN